VKKSVQARTVEITFGVDRVVAEDGTDLWPALGNAPLGFCARQVVQILMNSLITEE
jgi:hypothetical protein